MEKYLDSKILIVDDEPANIFLLEGLLTEEGYKVNTASDGHECLKMLNEYVPDIILLDIMMPGMTGIEVLQKIQSDEKLNQIPVIMVTAKTESENVEETLDKGAIEYIKKPIDEIELLARVRTALRIKKQEDKLKIMLQSKEEFIKIISHDLRTPFSSISGFAEILYFDDELRQHLNEEHKDFLKFIINTSQQTVDYFNKLLNWTELGAKEIILNKNEVNLLQIANSAAITYKNQMDEKNIQFNINVDGNTFVNVDVTYFNQVIKNLLNNAIKFTPVGGNISINFENEESGLKIIISDSGIGIKDISPEEMFGNSINKSTRGTKGEKGTGLGLGICKKIIDAHGFNITFKSKENEGTDFIITLN